MEHFAKSAIIGLAFAIMAATASFASAQGNASYKVMVTANDFESAVFGLENAIVNRGLVIDATGHVGTMLTRTAKATGSNTPYLGARYLGFCSAKLSAAAMRADPENLAVCPYVMFVYELKSEPGKARIGYRRPMGASGSASKKAIADIETLLGAILKEAAQ